MKWSRFNYMFESEKHGPLLYNSYTNAFAELDADSYQKLQIIQKNPDDFKFESVEDRQMLEMLLEGKILIEEGDDEPTELKMETIGMRASTSGLSLTLAPTTDCNFCCPYCF